MNSPTAPMRDMLDRLNEVVAIKAHVRHKTLVALRRRGYAGLWPGGGEGNYGYWKITQAGEASIARRRPRRKET
jgi:hypothetical protein|tara:strand:- start:2735 stop:2956 length:222 start_codon:yes stop_codon:yes gene_type:complete